MANLLNDSALWTSDPAGNSPPEYWDGTDYSMISPGYPSGQELGMSLSDSGTGNTLFANVNYSMEAVGTFTDYLFIVEVNGVQELTQPLEDGGGSFVIDLSLPDNANVFIYVENPNFYGYTVTLNPAQPVEHLEYYVYELDRGWTFDGNYIPHFVELNWYFGEDPFTYTSMQKIRIHGLTKGTALLEVAVAGMQTEYDSDYTEPQYLDLPMNPIHVSTEFLPTTNYVDSSNFGISIQLKFEGRNTDITKPEPAHVIQVLAIQTAPQDTGKRAN